MGSPLVHLLYVVGGGTLMVPSGTSSLIPFFPRRSLQSGTDGGAFLFLFIHIPPWFARRNDFAIHPASHFRRERVIGLPGPDSRWHVTSKFSFLRDVISAAEPRDIDCRCCRALVKGGMPPTPFRGITKPPLASKPPRNFSYICTRRVHTPALPPTTFWYTLYFFAALFFLLGICASVGK